MSRILATNCDSTHFSMAMDDMSYPHCAWVSGQVARYARFYGNEWRVVGGTAVALASDDELSISKFCLGFDEIGNCFFVLLEGNDLIMMSWIGTEWTRDVVWPGANAQDLLAWSVAWAGFPVVTAITRSFGNKTLWAIDKSSGSWGVPSGVVIPSQDNLVIELKAVCVASQVYVFWNGKNDSLGTGWIGHAEWDRNTKIWTYLPTKKIEMSEYEGDISGLDFVAADEWIAMSSETESVSHSSSSSSSVIQDTGGYLVWVSRKTGGESHVHGCRINQTEEFAITESIELPDTSQLDSYVAPVAITSANGYSPFYPEASVYVDSAKNPKFLCLSNGITMFAAETSIVESKKLNVPLYDTPVRMISGQLPGQLVGICLKMTNGDVVVVKTEETADVSSSSSSFSSFSSTSSSSTSSQFSTSSSSSTVRLTSSWSSVSSASSSSTVRFTSSSSSTQSITSWSSLTSISSSNSSSSISSASWMCDWELTEEVNETFTDMDGHPGGTGTVSLEFSNWNLEGLNTFNTDSCSTLWCVYVPQGSYGVGGSAIGMVYLYKNSGRPAAPPYGNSALVGKFELDSSTRYGTGWPKTLPISDAGTGSGISGTVQWAGGTGHGTLPVGCSAYRLQIPFKLVREESSVSSISSSSFSSKSSSNSSASLCGTTFGGCTYVAGNTNICTWLKTPPYSIGGICELNELISKYEFPGCAISVFVQSWSQRIGLTTYYHLDIGVSPVPGIDVAVGSMVYATLTGSAYTWLFTEGWFDLTGSGDWSGRGNVGRIYVAPQLIVTWGRLRLTNNYAQ